LEKDDNPDTKSKKRKSKDDDSEKRKKSKRTPNPIKTKRKEQKLEIAASASASTTTITLDGNFKANSLISLKKLQRPDVYGLLYLLDFFWSPRFMTKKIISLNIFRK
jgi:hypothetical protein